MVRREDLTLCAGLRGVALHYDAIVEHRLNLEVQHFVSAIDDDWPLELAAAQLSRLRRDAPGIRFGFHAPFRHANFFSKNAGRAERSQRALFKSLEVAASLEAEFVVVHSLFTPRRRNRAYGADWRDVAAPFLQKVAREAARLGFRVVIENLLEPSPESLLWLLERIDLPGTGICFDPAHAAIAGGVPAVEWVERLSGALLHMHLSDNRGVHDDHLPPGRGTVDLAGALGAARRLRQPVSIAIECRLWPVENLETSLSFLADVVDGWS